MDLRQMAPIVLYDNRCYLCARFARIVNWLARRSLFLVGHYTELGEKLREEILDSSALEMFWFIDGKTAYGGRAALLPLLVAVLRKKPTGHIVPEEQKQCSVGCRTAKAVFVRSASLLTHSKKITIE